jgi:hypothetical protein
MTRNGLRIRRVIWRATNQREPMKEFDLDVVEEIHQDLLNNDVVDGPPELKELVEELWPELLHKVKPPRALMH